MDFEGYSLKQCGLIQISKKLDSEILLTDER